MINIVPDKKDSFDRANNVSPIPILNVAELHPSLKNQNFLCSLHQRLV